MTAAVALGEPEYTRRHDTTPAPPPFPGGLSALDELALGLHAVDLSTPEAADVLGYLLADD